MVDAFRFLRQPDRPIAPRPFAKRGNVPVVVRHFHTPCERETQELGCIPASESVGNSSRQRQI